MTLCLASLARVLVPPGDLKVDDGDFVRLEGHYLQRNRFTLFVDHKLWPMLRHRDTPLVSIALRP